MTGTPWPVYAPAQPSSMPRRSPSCARSAPASNSGWRRHRRSSRCPFGSPERRRAKQRHDPAPGLPAPGTRTAHPRPVRPDPAARARTGGSGERHLPAPARRRSSRPSLARARCRRSAPGRQGRPAPPPIPRPPTRTHPVRHVGQHDRSGLTFVTDQGRGRLRGARVAVGAGHCRAFPGRKHRDGPAVADRRIRFR